MSDMISRDAAIRALVQAHEETGVKTAQAIRIIRELPTVDAIPWEKLERYAEFFCADVPYTEFVREAKRFCIERGYREEDDR